MMTNDILKQLQKYYYEVGFDDGDLIQAAMKEIESLRAENERLSQPQEAVAVLIADPMFLPALNVPLMDWKVDVTNLPIGTELYTSQPNDKAEIARLEDELEKMHKNYIRACNRSQQFRNSFREARAEIKLLKDALAMKGE